MALSRKPTTENKGTNKLAQPPTPPTGGIVPPPPVGGVSSPPSLSNRPTLKKRNLMEEDDYINKMSDKKKLGNIQDAQVYQSAGSLTAQDLLTLNYDEEFARLEDVIVEVKTWLQEYLTDQELVEQVANARANRSSDVFKNTKEKLDRILIQRSEVRSFSNSKKDTNRVISFVMNEILGFGPIEPLWMDSRITEIMVNGPSIVYVEIGGKLQRVPGAKFRDSDHLLETCQQMLSAIGKSLDVAHNREDGRLPDGSRINATHPAIGPAGPFLTIRRFPESVFTLRKLVESGSMTPEMVEQIGNLVYHKSSTIVSGGTGSGKTSMLNALSGCIPETDRIITIEDNLELRLHPSRHVVALESRKAQQADSKGNVTIRDLVMNALRMRPERIVVGEVRDGTAYDMLQAMNTGHEGSMTTIHANDAQGAIERLSNLIAQVGELSSNQALTLISSGVDIIVSISRYEDGSRRVDTISEIPSQVNVDSSGHISLEPRILWEFVQTGIDENNKIIGEYQKVNDISDSFEKKHRLSKKRWLSYEELLDLSDWDGKG